MESLDAVLDCLLPEESLNNLIQTTSCLEILNYLLRVKYRRVLSGQCEKSIFNITCIYDKGINYDTGALILETTLLIATNPDVHLTTTKKYCLDKFQSTHDLNELQYVFNLFKILLKYRKNLHEQLNLTDDEVNQLHEAIITVLKGSSKPLIIFIIIDFIPNYLSVSDRESRDTLLIKIFNYIKVSKKLDILCLAFDKFDTLSLMNRDDFWLLLTHSMVQNHLLQKQAAYLLSKCVQIIATETPHNYLQTKNNETENVWRNYLTLLDISGEKQLHIIEPSLCMFTSILSVHHEWRLCLYKIFLKHSQNAVVYYVASFIVENETEWTVLSKIIRELLVSINKNEYGKDCRLVFGKIGKVCAELTEAQFRFVLEESLSVLWVPAAAWGFFSHIFPENRISCTLLEGLLTKFKQIPHKFIRNGCIKVVLSNFIANCKIDTLRNFLKISILLHGIDKNMFGYFTSNCGQTYSEALCAYFIKCDNLKEAEIILDILHLLKVDAHTLTNVQQCCNKTDLIYLFRVNQNCNLADLEEYLSKRVVSINWEDVSTLLSLTEKFSTTTLIEKSLDILSQNNVAQTIVALNIVKHKEDNLKQILDSCKNTVFKTRNETLTGIFVEILCKYMAKTQCNLSELDEFIDILEAVLDSQSKTSLTVFDNIAVFLQYVDQDRVFHFIGRCLDEFLNTCKNGNSKSRTDSFLTNIFVPHLLENVKFSTKLQSFCAQLLDIAKCANTVAFILSKKIVNFIEHSPEKGVIFIPTIVDLILRGILINKSDKVEYSVCQEIGLTLSNNPNLTEMSTRLWAFESMLTLINKQSLHNRDVVTNELISLLLQKYMKYFCKRYFPDSQIHLQKLRIIQALILLRDHLNKSQKYKLIDFITGSFLEESHQPSVKHLMQWLLIYLVKNDDSFVFTMREKLKMIDNNRPSTVSGFIPVLYHLVICQDESQWDRFVEVLVAYTMGAQFKLRIFSQVALLKLYEKAVSLRYTRFVQKYDFLYNALKEVVEATRNASYDVECIYHEFLDYFCIEDYSCSSIFYTIPKLNGVTCTEWENLSKTVDNEQMTYIKFDHVTNENWSISDINNEVQVFSLNIQKKVTPWKDMFDNLGSQPYTNDFILITSLIEKPANLGGLSRTCEVFGIKHMVMRTSKVVTDKEFKSLSMSSENWVDITEVKAENLQSFIMETKKRGYSVIGAEQTSESVKLDTFQFPQRMALLLGNEKAGIAPNLIPLLDACIEIPQFGVVRSLNVHVAGAIVIWEYCKQQKL